MLFPVNFTMDQANYQYRGQDYEAFYFGEDRGATGWIEGNIVLLIGSEKLLITENFKKYKIGKY